MLLGSNNFGQLLAKFFLAQVVSLVGQKNVRSSKTRTPHVGIFFMDGERIFMESTPVEKGEACAGFVNHPGAHETYWEHLQAMNLVARDELYECVPRGRALFNQASRQFVVYVDKCILRKPHIVRSIKAQLGLPSRTEIRADDMHYRCSTCLAGDSL